MAEPLFSPISYSEEDLPPHLAEAEKVRIAAIRRMTPAEKWQVIQNLYWFARDMKSAGVRSQHPEWSEEQVQTEVKRIFLHASR